MTKTLQQIKDEEFVKKSISVHGNKYLYGNVVYIKNNIDVIIECKTHGLFFQKPNNHLNGKGCYKCGKENFKNTINNKRIWDFKQPEEYKLIPLTKGKFAKVDNEDFDRLKDINWLLTSNGYASNDSYGRMHRFILNADDNSEVDHIDRDRLNNRRSNLREASRRQNNLNSSPKKGSSVYKGVHVSKRNGKCLARIKVLGKSIHLGTFENEKDAAKVYDQAALEHFGEFAYLNFPNLIIKHKGR